MFTFNLWKNQAKLELKRCIIVLIQQFLRLPAILCPTFSFVALGTNKSLSLLSRILACMVREMLWQRFELSKRKFLYKYEFSVLLARHGKFELHYIVCWNIKKEHNKYDTPLLLLWMLQWNSKTLLILLIFNCWTLKANPF